MPRPRFTIGRFLVAQAVVASFLGVAVAFEDPTGRSIGLALFAATAPALIILLASSAMEAFKAIRAIVIGLLAALSLGVLFLVVLLVAGELRILLVIATSVSFTTLSFLAYDAGVRSRTPVEIRFLDDPPRRH